ncbi:hypothetical protein N431DRAFT_182218 [Stipitochalara longipes BDJ]|nr:hypothetical protein N431DRAFT_182218 [Stipitochalara longipes BDJ]
MMGNFFSLAVQADYMSGSNATITSHIYEALFPAAVSSTISNLLLDNRKQSDTPIPEVLSSIPNNGGEYTTILVTTQISSASIHSEVSDSYRKTVPPSLQHQEVENKWTPASRLQPRAQHAEVLHKEAAFDSYEAPAKDRAAVEQKYVSPPNEESTDSLDVSTRPIGADTDITTQNHTTTKVSNGKAHTRRRPPLPTKTPIVVRIPHKPIQLFGRRHLHHVAELMKREAGPDG